MCVFLCKQGWRLKEIQVIRFLVLYSLFFLHTVPLNRGVFISRAINYFLLILPTTFYSFIQIARCHTRLTYEVKRHVTPQRRGIHAGTYVALNKDGICVALVLWGVAFFFVIVVC